MIRCTAILPAFVLAILPVGHAEAQLKAPEELFFANLPAEMKNLVEQMYVAPTPAQQAAAAAKLAATGEAAVPALSYMIRILGEPIDPVVRRAVVDGLVKIGKPALEQAIGGLKSSHPAARQSAIEVLGQLADKEAIAPVLDAFLHDQAGSVREAALAALAKLVVLQPAALEKVMATAQDKAAKPEIRGRAIKLIGRLAGPAVPVEPLVAILQDAGEDIRMRCAAADALGRNKSPAAVAPLVAALADKSASMRVWAAVALNGSSDPSAIAALVKAIGDENERVRVRAADALASVHDAKVIDPLTKALGDANAEVRAWAAVGLGNFSDPRVVPSLGDALRDADVGVRVRAADALGRTHLPEATPLLIQTVGSVTEDAQVRCASARALGGRRDSRAVPTLIGLVRDNDPALRQWVVAALGRIGDARAVEPLIGAAEDAEAQVRAWAVLALSRFRDPRIIEPLVKAAKDADAQVRARAVLAMRVAINDPRVKAALQAAAEDSDPVVQEKARQALGKAG